jgi:hypothetical protein
MRDPSVDFAKPIKMARAGLRAQWPTTQTVVTISIHSVSSFKYNNTLIGSGLF